MAHSIEIKELKKLKSGGDTVTLLDVRRKKVAEKALEIAERTNNELDMELVGRGALFHDLGKARTHEIEHGKIGAEMGKSLGLPDGINAVMEKHIRGGLTEEEATELNLPVKY